MTCVKNSPEPMDTKQENIDHQKKVLAHRVDSIDENQQKKMFNRFDKDGNGTISTKDLDTVMSSLSLGPKDKRQGIINRENADGNGTIDFHKFLTLTAQLVDQYHLVYKDGCYVWQLVKDCKGCDGIYDKKYSTQRWSNEQRHSCFWSGTKIIFPAKEDNESKSKSK